MPHTGGSKGRKAARSLPWLTTCLIAGLTAGTAMADTLRLRTWQAPATLNPYLSAGAKDVEAASIVLEPLARTDPQGELIPWLTVAIPTVQNGGLSADGMSITWQLREGLTWSDGTPLTSADVKFTWEYCMAPGAGCAQAMKFDGITRIDTPDAHTVTLHFDAPRPMPYDAFVGPQSPILQKAQFADCLGPKAHSCSAQNHAPTGTGPYVVAEFQPGSLARFIANPAYRIPGLPRIPRAILQGGGDAAGAARAVLQTGEADFATNLQLPPRGAQGHAEGRNRQVTHRLRAASRTTGLQPDRPRPGAWARTLHHRPPAPDPFRSTGARRALCRA